MFALNGFTLNQEGIKSIVAVENEALPMHNLVESQGMHTCTYQLNVYVLKKELQMLCKRNKQWWKEMYLKL